MFYRLPVEQEPLRPCNLPVVQCSVYAVQSVCLVTWPLGSDALAIWLQIQTLQQVHRLCQVSVHMPDLQNLDTCIRTFIHNSALKLLNAVA